MTIKHKHHIIPKHMGGTDDKSNLIELTVEKHAAAHKELYEKYGKYEDLCAYYMLSGKNKEIEFIRARAKLAGTASFKKRLHEGLSGVELFYGRKVDKTEHEKNSSLGGKKQGLENSKNGHIREIQKNGCYLGGKKGAEVCREKKVNAFFDPNLKKEISKMGGQVQGKINSENGHCKKISLEYWEKVRTGIIKRKKKIWVTDGSKNKMINEDEEIDNGWRKGKTQKRKIQ